MNHLCTKCQFIQITKLQRTQNNFTISSTSHLNMMQSVCSLTLNHPCGWMSAGWGEHRAYLHTVPVEPARMAGRTFEDGVGQDGLDGVQTDGAGLRQTEVWTHTQRLSGTVIRTERPGHKDTGSDYWAKSGFGQKKNLYSYFSIANIKVGSLYMMTEWVGLLSANRSAVWRRRQFYFQRWVLRFPHRRKIN